MGSYFQGSWFSSKNFWRCNTQICGVFRGEALFCLEFPGLKGKPKNFRGFSKKYVLDSACLVFLAHSLMKSRNTVKGSNFYAITKILEVNLILAMLLKNFYQFSGLLSYFLAKSQFCLTKSFVSLTALYFEGLKCLSSVHAIDEIVQKYIHLTRFTNGLAFRNFFNLY